MIGFAVSFIIGIAAFNFFPFFPATIITTGIIIALFLLLKYRKNSVKLLIIPAVVFGLVYSLIRHDPGSELRMPDGESLIQGTVIDVPEMSRGMIRFTIDDVSIGESDIKDGAMYQTVHGGAVNRMVHGMVRLYMLDTGLEYPALSPGDRIRAWSRLKEPHMFHNPGVYSYDLKKQGIVAIGFLKQVRVIGTENGFFARVYKTRQKIGEIMDNSLSPENASLHKAIIPGLKRGIGREMRQAFSATGLAHILSISGTHFGLLAFIIFKLFKMLVKLLPNRVLVRMTLYITPTQIAVVGTLPLLVLYALISGASTPTIRALVMVFIYMLALFLGRRGQWLNSLSIAAVLILLWQPMALFELSFLLSFIAVLSIGLVLEKKDPVLFGTGRSHEPNGSWQAPPHSPPEADRLRTGQAEHRPMLAKALGKLKTAMLITVAAVLGTAPFVALYFKQFPLISPVTNLIVTPLICFVILPLGFFAVFGALLFNMPVMPLNALIDKITHVALSLVKAFSEVPYANIHIHNPSFVMVALYFLSLLFIVKTRVRWRFLPFVFVIGCYSVSPYISSNDLRVTFLDVGQGESSVIELPDEKIMLIDGGTGSPDMGRMVIAPYLWSKGIKHIDYLVLSHAHPDHYGGLIYVMDNFKIGEIWFNGRSIPEAGEFFRKIKEREIPKIVLKRGDVLETEEYKVLVLHPYDEFFAGSSRGEFSDQNSDSLVLKIESDDLSVLFTGDIEKEAEENLVHLSKWLKSDIIKVPHHGGRTSSSSAFVKAVG
ncbi:MAG TPA: DNA internalization-related competence protein ComEC/Rec2, partial [Nitrospirae bacterium]|nr:DNA internalization-related competence protein ComEC/Rec2 [Nitrospirota bacterium]